MIIECGIAMKLVKLIKTCLNETNNRVRLGRLDMFPIKNGLKQGNCLLPLIFKLTGEYAIRRVQAIQEGLKLNYTRQRLVYADDVNTLGGTVHTIKKNTENLVVASKDIGLDVNTAKTKHLVWSRD